MSPAAILRVAQMRFAPQEPAFVPLVGRAKLATFALPTQRATTISSATAPRFAVAVLVRPDQVLALVIRFAVRWGTDFA
jgi:hypothetical protein